MKIFRQLIDAKEMGWFIADAIHEDGKIQSLKVHPISSDGMIEQALTYCMDTLSELVEKMQEHVTKSIEE
jgi:hypothetical protein